MSSSYSRTEVYYRNRLTQDILLEKNLDEKKLRWLYEHPIGCNIFQVVLNSMFFGWLYGKYQSSSLTQRKIRPFVTQHQIDLQEIEQPLNQYRSFNAFFSRRLKRNARPFDSASEIFCSPGDGNVLVYPHLTSKTPLMVKGSEVNLKILLASEQVAKHFMGGSALIVRLAPYDYHRFHFPDEGKAHSAREIPGQYHSVNPIALAQTPGIYMLNKRAITIFESDNFGRIAYLEVGAMTIGSIVQTYVPGKVLKGQEKGYFQYGGSTVLLLFEPNTILFDRDLIEDSTQGLEVRVRAGERIGHSF